MVHVLQIPDIVNTTLDHQWYSSVAETATTLAAATTTSCSNVSELVCDESDGSESATPDMDSQLLYVKLKEVSTAAMMMTMMMTSSVRVITADTENHCSNSE